MKKSFTFLLIVLLNATFCFSQNSNIATLNLTVTDQKGNFIKDLKKEDLKLFLKDKPIEIISLEKSVSPLCIGVLFDVSKSMRAQAKTELHEYRVFAKAFENFVINSNSENEYFLVTFAEKQHLLLDTTRDQSKILETLRKLSSEKKDEKEKRNSLIFDSLNFGYEKLTTCKTKKVLILISEGIDNLSKSENIKNVDKLLESNQIVLYTTNLFSEESYFLNPFYYYVKEVEKLNIAERTLQTIKKFLIVKSENNEISSRVGIGHYYFPKLNDLSLNTGGRLFLPMNADEAKEAFEYLAEELKNQYILTFKNQVEPNSKRQKIKIEISGEKSKEKLIVRTRKEI